MLDKNSELKNKMDNKEEEMDVMSDIRYICKSCSLITESLKDGCDVMQMPNGDIIVSQLKTVTYQYSWDNKKGKLIRTQLGTKKSKSKKTPEKIDFPEEKNHPIKKTYKEKV